MGLRFRRSFKVFPGVRLHLSKSGFSTSFGVRGASINVGSRGVRGTVGIPGTGLSYSAKLHSSGSQQAPVNTAQWWVPTHAPGYVPVQPSAQPSPITNAPCDGLHQISSAPVEWLTSEGLEDLKSMLIDARQQRADIQNDVVESRKALKKFERELRVKNSFLRFLFTKRVAELTREIPEIRRHIGELNSWSELTHVDIVFETGDQALTAYGALVRAFEACRQCQVVWDVTADRATNRNRERTTATRTVDRTQVRFEFDDNTLIRFQGRAMKLTNANGDNLLLYPGLILIPRADGQFALLDYRDIVLSSEQVSFIESEIVPADSKIIGHAWAKANKDGSPDRRFANNYQLPICEYGRICFTSKTGLNEEFQFSNSTAAASFAQAFSAFVRELAMRAT